MIFDSQRFFTHGCLIYDDVLGATLQDREVKEEHTLLAWYEDDEWDLVGDPLDWTAIGLVRPDEKQPELLALSPDGEACVFSGKGVKFEQIADELEAPLTGLGVVNNKAFAVGMGYQVWRRDGPGDWKQLYAGDPDEPVGFTHIHGFGSRDLYAVGWSGAIWRYKAKKWGPETSPTQETLGHVCCASDGKVYACGSNGVLLEGKDGKWKQIDLGEAKDHLWSLVEYEGAIYGSGEFGVFRLGPNGIESPDFGDDELTFRELSVAGGCLCSVGEEDILVFDGEDWSAIPVR